MPSYKEDCRGNKKRKNIVTSYEIEPHFGMNLLPGQEFYSCCTKILVEYNPNTNHKLYVFKIKHKDNNYEQILVMGQHCAEELIKEANQNNQNIVLPRIINLFRVHNTGNGGGNNGNNPVDPNEIINKQLLKAIFLLVILSWKGKGLSVKLSNIVKRISNTQNIGIIDNDEICYFFNGVLDKDRGDNLARTLTEVYNDVSTDIDNLGNITFTQLENYFNSIDC